MSRSRRQYRAHPQELGGSHSIDTGTADFVPDDSGQTGWTVVVNGVPSSHVHINDPTRLDFEYMQWMGHVIDAMPGAGEPLNIIHIGGAGCSLALYTASTRPGSKQTVFEIDTALITLARQAFGLRGIPGLRIRSGDGRAGMAATERGRCDVVIRDAFDGRIVPEHLTTLEFYRETSHVLRPGGVFLANVADTTKVSEAKVEAAAAQQVFTHVALIVDPGQLRGRRYGNVVLVASDDELPEEVLVRKLAGGAVRARYVEPEQVVKLTVGVSPRHDSA